MKMLFLKVVFAILAIFVLVLVVVAIKQRKANPRVVSEFGKYQGYSEAIYDGRQRLSDFLTLSDGTRLAYDLFLPMKKGVPASQPLPALFKYTPYGRAWTIFDKEGKPILCELYPVSYCELMLRLRAWVMPHGSGRIKDAVSRTEWLGEMLKYGYAVIVVDRPGTGASFGKFNGDPEIVAGETDEILNWIADQPWSNGNIGMFGDSIQAQIQFRAASTGNPHLKAILPATTWMDNYSAVMFPGGILDQAMASFYAKANTVFDAMATPVDQDKEGALLVQARAERQNTSALAAGVQSFEGLPFRDMLMQDGQEMWLTQQTLYPLLDKINRSGVAVYLINGWYDIYARDNFLIYNNLTVPKRLLVRPTDHAGIESPGSDIDFAAEAHRWFDYWLKGIDNGIMDETPIHYYLQGVNKARAWQDSNVWPLSSQKLVRYYLEAGEGGTGNSVNDGGLSVSSPTDSQAFDAYTIDYTTTTGKNPLWTGLAVSHKYPNLRSNDAKALTYTTLPLEAAITIVGHPIVRVWLSTDAPDLDAFIYLEEVDLTGHSTYITEGELRASHRQLSQAPFDSFGLPWFNHFQSELAPISADEPFELVFDLRPTAWQFSQGKQICITMAFADSGNFDTPVLDPAPTLRLLRDVAHASYIDLPILNQTENSER
jgi:putative CocE/NonD family hydrolase